MVSYLTVFSDFRINLVFLAIFIPAVAVTLLIHTYAIYLEKSLGISPSGTGYILGCNSIIYMIFCPMMGFIC